MVEEQHAAPGLAVVVLRKAEPNPALITHVLDVAAGVAHQPYNILQWVNLLVIAYGGFMVAIACHEDNVLPWLEKLGRLTEYKIKVIAA
jgi:hypothetical protein